MSFYAVNREAFRSQDNFLFCKKYPNFFEKLKIKLFIKRTNVCNTLNGFLSHQTKIRMVCLIPDT